MQGNIDQAQQTLDILICQGYKTYRNVTRHSYTTIQSNHQTLTIPITWLKLDRRKSITIKRDQAYNCHPFYHDKTQFRVSMAGFMENVINYWMSTWDNDKPIWHNYKKTTCNWWQGKREWASRTPVPLHSKILCGQIRCQFYFPTDTVPDPSVRNNRPTGWYIVDHMGVINYTMTNFL